MCFLCANATHSHYQPSFNAENGTYTVPSGYAGDSLVTQASYSMLGGETGQLFSSIQAAFPAFVTNSVIGALTSGQSWNSFVGQAVNLRYFISTGAEEDTTTGGGGDDTVDGGDGDDTVDGGDDDDTVDGGDDDTMEGAEVTDDSTATLNADHVRAAFAEWSEVANVNFTEVNSAATADITVEAADILSQGLAGVAFNTFTITGIPRFVSSEIQIDNTLTENTAPGSFGFLTLLHEIGHALGLKHPGLYNGGGESFPFLPQNVDSAQNSVMSYNNGALVSQNINPPVTPMIFDIAAIQHLYGARTNNPEDTLYVLNFNEFQRTATIWDSGGIDEIRVAEATTTGITMHLREGPEFVNRLGDDVIFLAYNANNDTIFGGLGHDQLYGNAGNDIMYGGRGQADSQDGNDTMYGGIGADQLFGNAGNDFVYGGGNRADPGDNNDTIYGGKGADQLFGNGGDDLIFGGGDRADPGDNGDTIYGGVGNDSIYGNGGNDWLAGQDGSDQLHGGLGDDIYYFSNANAVDTILHFEGAGVAGGDIIQLTQSINGLFFNSLEEVLARVSYGNGNALLDLNQQNQVLIHNIAEGGLSTLDFQLV